LTELTEVEEAVTDDAFFRDQEFEVPQIFVMKKAARPSHRARAPAARSECCRIFSFRVGPICTGEAIACEPSVLSLSIPMWYLKTN